MGAEPAVSGSPRRRRRTTVLAGLGALVVIVLVIGGVLALRGDGGGRPHLTNRHAPPPPSLPSGVSEIAQVSVPRAGVYDDPSAPTPSRTFDLQWHVNDDPNEPTVPRVFLVEEKRAGWVRVLLPVRPNGSSGWIHAGDLTLSRNPYHIDVSLGTHQITVLDGRSQLYRGPVATGAPDTPTPTGRYFVVVLLQTTEPNSVYGPYAYGLSAHSDVLTQFDGGDGETGIHGNNDASVLGKSVTHGCVRMDNDAITRLTKLLPLGTPVQINA